MNNVTFDQLVAVDSTFNKAANFETAIFQNM